MAVFASGQGTNFEALVLESRRGRLGGSIRVLVTDAADTPALARAQRLGIEALTLPVGRYRTRIEDERPWLAALAERHIELILLAGFMRRLHAGLLDAFPDRVLNVHPSLLPAFPGLDAIGQAWEHGVRVTGCTVHLVDEAVDGGAILAQESVAVVPGDTRASLEARIHDAEHRLYPDTVRRFVTEPWHRRGRRIEWGASSPSALEERGSAA